MAFTREPNASDQYRPVPVSAAKAVGQQYAKSIVVILSWDPLHEKLHTTTWGLTENDKHMAALGGELAATALGFDLFRGTKFEDFRAVEARLLQAILAVADIERISLTEPKLAQALYEARKYMNREKE